MFGRMMVEPVLQVDPGVELQTAVAGLIRLPKTSRSFAGSNCRRRPCCPWSCPGIRIPGQSMSWIVRKEPGTRSTSRTSNSAATAYTSSKCFLRSAVFSISLSAQGFGAPVCGGWCYPESGRRRPFDRKNIPGYLPTPTHENRAGNGRKRALGITVAPYGRKEVTAKWRRQSQPAGRSSRITKRCS